MEPQGGIKVNRSVGLVFRLMRDFRVKSLPVSEGEMGAGGGGFDFQAFQLPLPQRTGNAGAEPRRPPTVYNATFDGRAESLETLLQCFVQKLFRSMAFQSQNTKAKWLQWASLFGKRYVRQREQLWGVSSSLPCPFPLSSHQTGRGLWKDFSSSSSEESGSQLF